MIIRASAGCLSIPESFARKSHRCILEAMRDHLVGGIYVVQATKDGLTEFWAAATIRADAVATVQKVIGPEWTVVLTDRRLTNHRLSTLKLRPNGVQKLST